MPIFSEASTVAVHFQKGCCTIWLTDGASERTGACRELKALITAVTGGECVAFELGYRGNLGKCSIVCAVMKENLFFGSNGDRSRRK